MKRNGFTLVELLAVIVVLGVIMAIAGTAVLGQRKTANIEEVKNMEKTLADLGPDVYASESLNDDSEFMQYYKAGNTFKISDDTLKNAGYLSKTIENPAGGDCVAYLVVYPTSDEMFKGYVDCSNLYATGQSGEDYNNESFTREINNNITTELDTLTKSD